MSKKTDSTALGWRRLPARVLPALILLAGLGLAGPLWGQAAFTDKLFVKVPGGSFRMGDPALAGPVHLVTVKDFYLAKYEVTDKELAEIGGRPDGGYPLEGRLPNRSFWLSAVKYCNARSQREGFDPCYTINGNQVSCDFTKNGYRLPTEAEWEYAARGGASGKSQEYAGGGYLDLYRIAHNWNTHNNAIGQLGLAYPPGQLQPNSLGLYDMSGNEWEWCWDWYGPYAAQLQTDPTGPASGTFKVARGGSWESGTKDTRLDYRRAAHPEEETCGFRLCRSSWQYLPPRLDRQAVESGKSRFPGLPYLTLGQPELWPQPRFVDNKDGTLTDRLTGLMWQQKPSPEAVNWEKAVKNCAALKLAGHTDWRLPNARELTSLVHPGIKDQTAWLTESGFAGIRQEWYWTATPNNTWDGTAYILMLSYNYNILSTTFRNQKSDIFSHLALAVRSTEASQAFMPATGQQKSLAPRDDGAVKAGLAWTAKRFVANQDGTISDTLTGLMWEQTPATTQMGWTEAAGLCRKLRTGGYQDWRLPHIQELESLVNYDQESAAYLNGCGFSGLVNGYDWASAYWSADETHVQPGTFWTMNFRNGTRYYNDRNKKEMQVLAVRFIVPPVQ